MTAPKPATPDHEILVLQGRITLALQRISAGYAPMRIPAQLTDPDLVLSDCAARIAADAETIRKQAEEIARLENRSGCEHCSDRRRVAEAELATAREQVRTLREALKAALGHCDCSDYHGKALIPCTEAHPCAGCRTTRTGQAALAATEPKG